MAEQVARGLGGQLSQPTLLWPSKGGRRRPRAASGCGGRRGFFSGGRGRQADVGGRRGGAGDGKEEERAQQGNTGEEGEMACSLCRLGLGRTRRGCERTCGLSGPTHFGPKSETEMDARGRLRTALSVWSPRWTVYSVRADTLGRELVVCVGSLEMPCKSFIPSSNLGSLRCVAATLLEFFWFLVSFFESECGDDDGGPVWGFPARKIARGRRPKSEGVDGHGTICLCFFSFCTDLNCRQDAKQSLRSQSPPILLPYKFHER
jgi:hypothetical protein